MIMCVLLCYPVSIHMSQLLSTGCPISSLIIHFKAFNDSSLVFSHCFYFFLFVVICYMFSKITWVPINVQLK